MIDTNAINYGITKLQSAFSTIQPAAAGYTEQFIKYTVFKQVLETTILFFAAVVFGLFLIRIFKYGKGETDGFNNYDEAGFVIPMIICSIGILIGMIGFFMDIYGTVLALNFPEMFTIQSLIQK